MTHRLVLGIDPGQSGAIAIVADGVPAGFIDMPVMPRKTSGFEINGSELAARLRGVMQQHPGAYMFAVLEQVNAMPSIPGADGVRRQMGSSSGFRFGESFGVIKGVLQALGIGFKLVVPRTWKTKMGLSGSEKDFSRTEAIRRFPQVAMELQLKKHVGRADALLIASWAETTEQIAA